VATGGILFVAFPLVLATAFPAYYLALFLVLWTLIFRGLALEFRGHIPSPLWRAFWDFVLAVSSAVLAILFGTAIGNVVRGMPLAPNTPLMLPFFTDFGVRGRVGILDWYTLSTALFTLVCLGAHGASYLTLRTEGDVYLRSRSLAKWLWIVTVVLLIAVSAETMSVRPELFTGFCGRPAAWATVAVAAGGIGAIFTGLRSGSEFRVFLGGCAFIAGLLGTAAASLFPVILYSTLAPGDSMTAWNGSSDAASLTAAAYWWPVAFLLTLFYFGYIVRFYRERVKPSEFDPLVHGPER
jgi:cytochrome d ubiquinol oxidase subunit II